MLAFPSCEQTWEPLNLSSLLIHPNRHSFKPEAQVQPWEGSYHPRWDGLGWLHRGHKQGQTCFFALGAMPGPLNRLAFLNQAAILNPLYLLEKHSNWERWKKGERINQLLQHGFMRTNAMPQTEPIWIKSTVVTYVQVVDKTGNIYIYIYLCQLFTVSFKLAWINTWPAFSGEASRLSFDLSCITNMKPGSLPIPFSEQILFFVWERTEAMHKCPITWMFGRSWEYAGGTPSRSIQKTGSTSKCQDHTKSGRHQQLNGWQNICRAVVHDKAKAKDRQGLSTALFAQRAFVFFGLLGGLMITSFGITPLHLRAVCLRSNFLWPGHLLGMAGDIGGSLVFKEDLKHKSWAHQCFLNRSACNWKAAVGLSKLQFLDVLLRFPGKDQGRKCFFLHFQEKI